MKKLNFLLLVISLVFVNSIKAAETEPNNSKATANTLALNGNNTGAINVSGDEDWYSVTTNADGKLSVTITVSNGKTLRCYIYDNDGTTVLSSSYSSTTTTVSYDGAAEGTYYIKLIAYTNGQLPAYTVSNTLTKPAEANDAEPNDTKTQAKVLPLNNKKTGHVGYYYDLQRDTADWYKITTNADGRLRLTLSSGNGTSMFVYLYDNNGTTDLGHAYSSSNAVINADGLAAGTYYVKVNCYYTSGFAPYTLADSLFKPTQANDTEPNNTPAQAKVLAQDDNTTGHAGYLYNSQRDTADWYKITTNADGRLRLTLSSGNGTSMFVYLYDNNGTTDLGHAYSSSNAVINADGLAAGTYYVKVNCYYTSGFAPYTLADSLFGYDYSKDEEPNGNPYMAKTILANEFTDGHVGFYYNKTRDTVDWWKINYTGSGDLEFTINQETLKNGGTNSMYFKVYKDTNASPIHSSYSSSASRTVNLTGLTQGYYWIKVHPYYSSDFSSYSFSNTFTQKNIALIKPLNYDTAAVCASQNSITFTARKSQAPYTIQLFRFGIPYGSPVITSKKSIYHHLPAGLYYATVYGDGATGSAFGKSKSVSIEVKPERLTTTAIKSKQAKLNWDDVSCAAYFIIHYKVHGSDTWLTKRSNGNVTYYVLKGLAPNTAYDWTVAAADSANGYTAISQYAESISFTTGASLIADNDNDDEEDNLSINTIKNSGIVSIAPNPASSYFVIHYNTSVKQNLTAALYDVNGKPVWTSGLINADALNGKKVIVNQLKSGFYYLKITDDKGTSLGVAKVSITK